MFFDLWYRDDYHTLLNTVADDSRSLLQIYYLWAVLYSRFKNSRVHVRCF